MPSFPFSFYFLTAICFPASFYFLAAICFPALFYFPTAVCFPALFYFLTAVRFSASFYFPTAVRFPASLYFLAAICSLSPPHAIFDTPYLNYFIQKSDKSQSVIRTGFGFLHKKQFQETCEHTTIHSLKLFPITFFPDIYQIPSIYYSQKFLW